ncbi:phytanoyl-CoA dioxygenase domain-containing protein 1 homolog isoform X1 [Haliotis cracherodii]|uniref:phytanoyl-CoA dioxygenase domain-containing protein 1 homolog isoform X1 n=1 Tax=Haliotis cracherodii TaxID=6455 RepID=UPI0039E9EED5
MASHEVKPNVEWPAAPTITEWLQDKPIETWRNGFENDGYLIVEDLLTEKEVKIYQDLTSKMLSGEIDTSRHRHDLGNASERKKEDVENICQIMWPSLYVDNLDQGPLHMRTQAVANIIIGEDAVFDFDMFLSKAPHTNTDTPWHQDESYWGDVEDTRSASFWMAVDDAFKDNGCMWFVPGSHRRGLCDHRFVKDGCHVRTCDINDDEVKVAGEIRAGSVTVHHGRTLHYTRGNTTDKPRRAYVTAYRPRKMVDAFRQRGFDHGEKGIKDNT